MGYPVFDRSTAPPYQQALDYAGGSTGAPIYIGWATPGVSAGDLKWMIRKFTYDGNGQTTAIQYANGDVGFNFSWTLRANYTYK